MSKNLSDPEKNRQDFEKSFISDYLKFGSVDGVFKARRYDLPMSYSDAHRLVRRFGIIKAAGPNSRLSEALEFLTLLSAKKMPLEKLYKKMPASFQISMSTLHRILTYVRSETIRRVGTALVITSENDTNMILVGNDVSTPRPELGKSYGALSLPMGYSSRTESVHDSILRVLQQEVFTQLAVDRKLPGHLIPQDPKPFMYLDIADVRVAVYHLVIDSNIHLSAFSSYKLSNYQLIDYKIIIDGGLAGRNIRTGVKEIALGFGKYLAYYKIAKKVAGIEISSLNLKIKQLAVEFAH